MTHEEMTHTEKRYEARKKISDEDYYKLRVEVALNYAPSIYPCADCGRPVISGYSCTFCGSVEP